MLFPTQSSRQSRPQRSPKKLEVESLELRRLLAGDGIVPDPDGLIAEGGIVSGTKWEDVNRNGQRDPGEPGLAGVTIYADFNNNGKLDRDEPAVTTQRENPDTRFEEGGRYQLFVPPGKHIIREIVPDGFVQTFPLKNGVPELPVEDAFASVKPERLQLQAAPGDVFSTEVAITVHPICFRPYNLDVVAVEPGGGPATDAMSEFVEVISHAGPQLNGCGGDTTVFPIDIITHVKEVPSFELAFVDVEFGDILGRIPVNFESMATGGGHTVEMRHGDHLEGRDFGNARVRPATGFIEGRKWLDRDGNGRQDPGEPGLGGVTVYVDSNNNGVWERTEPYTVTQYENPFTDFDEGGLYHFEVPAGVHTVHEVVPDGYAQTFPSLGADVISSETGHFQPQNALDFDVTGVKFDSGADGTATHVQLSVTWNNGCGQLADAAAHAVIGNTILVDVSGQQQGEICTEALKTDTADVAIRGLSSGVYDVVGTLHEEQGASLGVVGQIELGTGGAHVVKVAVGEVVSHVDFGNRRTGDPESIHGVKWNDRNGDGIRQRDEQGLGGVTIYIDENRNGLLDKGERLTVSASDPDRLGHYAFTDLEPGIYRIREAVPEGYRQTFPAGIWNDPSLDPLPGIVPPNGGFHDAVVSPGNHLKGLNFGNQATTPGGISGTKWNDQNGNGLRDEGEGGLGGVTIYIDANYNRQRDEGELSAVTADDGSYTIGGVTPGQYLVLEVVPEGYWQTFPGFVDWWVDPAIEPPADDPAGIPNPDELRIWLPPDHIVNVLPGKVTGGINFGNQKVEPGSISGIKWHDENGNGSRDAGEAGLAGVTVYVDLNNNGLHEENEPSAVTQGDDGSTENVDESGRYAISGLRPFTSYTVREIVPRGYEQTFPGRPIDFLVPGVNPDGSETGDALIPVPFPFPQDFHSVWVGSGQTIGNMDFGNRKVAEPGFIRGMKWEDANGNGQREKDERGLAGFVIFTDLNRNGAQDFGEPFAVTQRDNPDTEADESGHYTLKVRPGAYLVLEQQQRGYEQIYPSPLREVVFPFNLGHSVDVASGQEVSGIDFGNKPVPPPATISGLTWLDGNANGILDRGEEPMSGITVYLDANDNGQLDEGERSVVSGQLLAGPRDLTDGVIINPVGFYSFAVAPGDYVVRQALPDWHIQTFPSGSYKLGETKSQALGDSFAKSLEFVSVESTTTSPNDSGQANTVLNLRTTWNAGAVEVQPTEVVVEGNRVLVRLTGLVADPSDPNLVLDDVPELDVFTQVHLGAIELGDYDLHVELFQEPHWGPNGEGEPFPGPVFELDGKFSFYGDDAHRVSVAPGQLWVGGRDFGHIAVPDPNPGDPGDPDAPEAMVGDTNGDRKVDFADFLTLSANFGKQVDGAFADGDFTGDAMVTFADFLLLSSKFGGDE